MRVSPCYFLQFVLEYMMYKYVKRATMMDVRVNDKLIMKKPHPCGGHEFLVTRIGMDFKMRCTKCSHEVMVPRKSVEKNIRKIIRENEE